MKRGAVIFWILYMLFFAIPFPIFMYYNINVDDIDALKDKNPWLALSILGISVVLWLILFAGYLRKWVLKPFESKRNIEYLKHSGVRREAKIVAVSDLSKPNTVYKTYQLDLTFKNLVDTEITQKAAVNDIRPHERRFEVGKKVDLLLDQEMKRIPYFIFSSIQASINKKIMLLTFLGWLLALAVVAAYYVYAYQSESYGYGWRFLSFGHPLIVCPFILFLGRVLLRFIFRKFANSEKAALIKFKGIKTAAKLIVANQTGIYINEQPMVRFELEYIDYKHQTHKNSLKKVVDLLNLHVTKQEYIDIFYLKEDPKIIAFASDLNEIS